MNLMRQHLIKLISSASFETTPKQAAADLAHFRTIAPTATRVSVTFLPGTAFRDTIEASKRLLHPHGLSPIPTFCARAFRNKQDVEESLQMLRDQLPEVDEVYVFAGSVSEPLGDFRTSMDLLETGLFDKYGIGRIGLASHPEGLQDVSDDELASALAYKNSFAADRTDAECFLVTQFCFESAPILQWEKRIRVEGHNRLPIHVGVPGIASVTTLLKHARNCGVGPSMRVLQQKGADLTKLVTWKPDGLLLDLAEARANDPECLIESVHWYPFGGIYKTAKLSNSIAMGTFAIDEDSKSLQVF